MNGTCKQKPLVLFYFALTLGQLPARYTSTPTNNDNSSKLRMLPLHDFKGPGWKEGGGMTGNEGLPFSFFQQCSRYACMHMCACVRVCVCACVPHYDGYIYLSTDDTMHHWQMMHQSIQLKFIPCRCVLIHYFKI